MRWVVDVGYPLGDDFDWGHDEELEAIADKYGADRPSSGTGFGMRDIQFSVSRKYKAVLMACEIEEQLHVPAERRHDLGGNTFDACTTEPYVGIYWEPKSYLVFLLSKRDFPEFLYILWRTITGQERKDRQD